METIELKGFPADIKFFVEEYSYVYRIQIAMTTRDRDHGNPMELHIYFSYPKENYTKVEAIRAALIETMTHEIDECLYVDGRRVFDPHDQRRDADMRNDLDRAEDEGMIHNERE